MRLSIKLTLITQLFITDMSSVFKVLLENPNQLMLHLTAK